MAGFMAVVERGLSKRAVGWCSCRALWCGIVLLAMTLSEAALAAAGSGAVASPSTASSASVADIGNDVGLHAEQLGVIVNDNDPNSVAIGREYIRAYAMPAANLLHIRFDPQLRVFDIAGFQAIKAALDQQTPATIQAYLVTWLTPYRVDNMSLTSALAFGWGPQWQSAKTCDLTARSPYFNSRVREPYTQLHMRLSMMLGARNLDEAHQLISRGQMAGTQQDGLSPLLRPALPAAYLMITNDRKRMVRQQDYPLVTQYFARFLPVHIVRGDNLLDRSDVMFYFTGRDFVDGLQTLHFLPGAMADHLTSFGGMIPNSPQMSAIRWLDAGATGSYGTVVEPCAFPQKFPRPSVAIFHYLGGQTLIESYWASVEEPGEGNFIGNPLAQPFKHGIPRGQTGGE